MATKRIETQLTIRAVDKYSADVRKMQTVTGRFADGVRTELGRLQGIRGPLKLIEDFKKKRDAVEKSANALSRAQERVRQLKAEIRATKNPTEKLRREFDAARKTADRLAKSHNRNREQLGGLRNQLRGAGVDTNDLASDERRLATALDRGTSAFDRRMEKMRRLDQMQQRIAAGRERMDRDLARAANLSFVGGASQQTGRRIVTALSDPLDEAKTIETAMSEIRKVVDFSSPADEARMKSSILDLSTDIPMLAENIADIVAAGGQSDFANDELLPFAERASKVGVAFDIAAEKSGTAMAKIRTALSLTLDETGVLFDGINHLSNNMASTAPDVLDFISRTGASGTQYGFAPSETLAFGSAMIAAGAQPDVAATSFRNTGRALARGAGATKRQSAAFKSIGLNPEDVAKRLQQDAVGTTIDVFERIAQLPEHLRASASSDIFGDEARAIAPLLTNLDLLREALGLVADEREFLGSVEREYQERAKTTENNEQLAGNEWKRLKTVAGETILPLYNELLVLTRELIGATTDWIKEHPKLTKWLLVGGLALGAMAVAGGVMLTAAAGLIGSLAVLRFGLVGLGARAIFAGGSLTRLGGRFRMLGRMPRFRLASLISPVRWGASLLPAVSWGGLASRSGKFGMNARGWGRLITPLKWFARGALRLIPVIGWAVMAAEIGMFAWKYLGLSELPWREWIPDIDWKGLASKVGLFTWKAIGLALLPWSIFIPGIGWENWFGFEWADLLPVWDWSAIVPKFDLSGFGLFGGSASGSSSDPAERAAVVRRGQSLGYGREVTPVTGARSLGGRMRAFHSYMAGERGPEPIFASRDSYVATHSQLVQMNSLARGAKSAASSAAGSLGGRGAPGLGGGVSIHIERFEVTAPSGVSDPDGLVDVMEDRLGERLSATLSASFSDG
ncbi:phage tail tape measure protein [Ruegeria sp. ANG-R]|uniref:phage tail tape measure protein n=1 Tax=Ruegeria sp. ANG-R TaxID=1577903 RepID=UPI00068A45D6|nr:phage tail tape measure protein [Ruegeria sp. ANG-R]